MNDRSVHQFEIVADPKKGWGVFHNELQLRTGKFLSEIKAPEFWQASPESAWSIAGAAALEWSESEMYISVLAQSEGGEDDKSPIYRLTVYHNWSTGYQVAEIEVEDWNYSRSAGKTISPVFPEISEAWNWGVAKAMEANQTHSRVELRLEFL